METGVAIGFGFTLFMYGLFSLGALFYCSQFVVRNAKSKWGKAAGIVVGVNLLLRILGMFF